MTELGENFEINVVRLDIINDPTRYKQIPNRDEYSTCMRDPPLALLYEKVDLPNRRFAIPCRLIEGRPLKVLHVTHGRDINLWFSIRKFIYSGKRLHVVIYCTNEKNGEITRNIYYTSQSEVGAWRYCTIRDDGGYDKGIDYVSTTYVHIQVQKFIHEVENDYDKTVVEDIPCPKSNDVEMKEFYKRLMDPSYQSNNFIFVVFNKIFPLSGEMLKDYASCIAKLRRKKEDRTIDATEREIYVSLYNKLERRRALDPPRPEHSRREFYGRVYDAMESLFSEFFKILDGTFEIIIPDYEYEVYGTKIKGNICQVKCECTHPNEWLLGRKYIIRYIIYQIDMPDRYSGTVALSDIEFKKAILHIVPVNSSITEFGLDSRYVSAGAFVNKIFDYIEQSPITHVGILREPEHDYRYIGDFTNYKFLPLGLGGRTVRK
jgi:hypothetical protein